MKPVPESSLAQPSIARQEFVKAMENWDEQKADAAIASLTRTVGAGEIFELLYNYAGRDFRSIGHKAIFVANAKRTLDCMGMRHAEPVLRSIAYAPIESRR